MALRPLVLHQGAIGDTIQLTALLEALAARWGAPCDVVSGRVPAAQILEGLDFVGEIATLERRRWPFLTSPDQWRLAAWLRRRGGVPTYLVEPRRHTVTPWSTRTRYEFLLERAGRPVAERLTMEDLPRAPLEHGVDYLLRLAAADPPAFEGAVPGSLPEPAPLPSLRVSDDERAACRRWLRGRGWEGEPLVLFQTTTRRASKGVWPRDRWAAVARAVLEAMPEARALLTGAPSEADLTAALAREVGDPRTWDVAGEMTLRRLFALLTEADSLLSMDSAPAHAAAALGCPVVVVCGRADPRRNRPLARSSSVAVVTAWPDESAWPDDPHAFYAEHDIRHIQPDVVLAAWRSLSERDRTGAD